MRIRAITMHLNPTLLLEITSSSTTWYHLERALKRIHGGVVVTTSSTMTESPEWAKRWAELGALGVECEASVIYTMTRLAGIPAAIALTVSDHVLREEPKQPSRELEEKVMEARRLTVRAAYEALRMYAEARED